MNSGSSDYLDRIHDGDDDIDLNLNAHIAEGASTSSGWATAWWRWPLIPIAAPAGAIIGSILFGFTQLFFMKMHGGFHEDGWYYLYIMPLVTSGVLGWMWCIISSAIAPTGKTITSTVMATVLAMLGAFILFVAFTQREKTTGERIQLVLAYIATLIGSICAVAQTYEEEAK